MPGSLHFSTSGFYLSPWFMLPSLISTDMCWVSWTELYRHLMFPVLTLLHGAQFICLNVHDTWFCPDNLSQSACYSHSSFSIVMCLNSLSVDIHGLHCQKLHLNRDLFWTDSPHCHTQQLVMILSQVLGAKGCHSLAHALCKILSTTTS